MNKYDEYYIINEYKEEITRAIAICKDFKISFEDFFKEKFLINYAYKLCDLPRNLYTNEYAEQKTYNEIFKKISFVNKALLSNALKIYINIKNLINYVCYIFDYDIMKLLAKRW